MKKLLLAVIIICITFLIVGGGIILINNYKHPNADGNSRKPNDSAVKEEKEIRILTIINKVDTIINEVHVTVGEGTELEHAYQKNPDSNSFSIEISGDYEEYDTFQISVIDRYDFKYEKEITNVPETGRTEVVMTEEDYVEQKGDWKKKIDKWFNTN